jgi:hypothetical protein
MLARMRSIELHVMEHGSDMDKAVVSGLLAIEELGTELACTACSEDVGITVAAYFPFAVILDEDSKWLMCTTCIEDVTDPSTSNESVELLSYIDDPDEIELF